MNLAAIIRAALSALALAHPTPSPRVDLAELSDDIASVVEARAALPFAGPRAAEATALALAAVAWHEGGLLASVDTCRRTGDAGRSITLWQLHAGRSWGGHSRAELCAERRLAAAQALEVLSHNGARGRSAGGLFASYAGNGGRASKASREICALWERLSRDAGLHVSCDSREAM